MLLLYTFDEQTIEAVFTIVQTHECVRMKICIFKEDMLTHYRKICHEHLYYTLRRMLAPASSHILCTTTISTTDKLVIQLLEEAAHHTIPPPPVILMCMSIFSIYCTTVTWYLFRNIDRHKSKPKKWYFVWGLFSEQQTSFDTNSIPPSFGFIFY